MSIPGVDVRESGNSAGRPMTAGRKPNPAFDDKLFEPVHYLFRFGLQCSWDETKADRYDLLPKNRQAVICEVVKDVRKREGESNWHWAYDPGGFLRVWLYIRGNHAPWDQHGAEISVEFTLKCYKLRAGLEKPKAVCPWLEGPGSGGSTPFEREWDEVHCMTWPGKKEGVYVCEHWVQENGVRRMISYEPCGVCYYPEAVPPPKYPEESKFPEAIEIKP